MAAIIDEQLVKHLSWLARLDLTKQEQLKLGRQLNDILDYVNQVGKLKQEAIGSPGELVNRVIDNLRKDSPRTCLSTEAALSNAPARQDGFYKVKAVLD